MSDYRENIPYETVESLPSRSQRESYWRTASALQITDGLKVSNYADDVAREYVSGNIDAASLVEEISSYHQTASAYHDDSRQAEADIVAARITELLEIGHFTCSVGSLLAIHSYLFKGVLENESWVGKLRSENIRKSEPILGGNSVSYQPYQLIPDSLEHDFELERSFRYAFPFDSKQVAHFTGFIASIWQIHPFREGNTRTIAVFSQLYLNSMGFSVDNTPFIENSQLFRDMLVKASFSSVRLGIDEDPSPLIRFFENVILKTDHELSSLDLNIHGIRNQSNIPYRNSRSSRDSR